VTLDDQRRWRISLHGGHSRAFSAHASSSLTELIETAIQRGMTTYGVTDHAPISDARFLYPDELEAGLNLPARFAQFDAYAEASREAVEQFAGRIELLRGFEAEIVPTATYVTDMQQLRQRHGFDYIVGSVHWVDELAIDLSPETFEDAVARLGGLEALLVRYYQQLAEMVEQLRPEVVGHFDLPRLYSSGHDAHAAASVRAAIDDALHVTAEVGSLIELNTAAYRKGLDDPYPAPPIVGRASELGIAFTFGDDSHHIDHVAANLDRARDYLLAHNVNSIGTLRREAGSVIRAEIAL
jgi:histidinol-phosphatase (PHP family)